MSLLDDVDKKIIEILKKDSRTPFTEVASKLDISDSTIHVRLKKLRDQGILLGYTVDLNEELLGKKVQGLMMINVTLGNLEGVVSKLIEYKSVSKIFEIHGENDLMVLINASDLNELRETLMEIRKMENIASTALITVLKVWK